MKIEDINLKDILIDENFNCRNQINMVSVVDLAKSIVKDGLIQPIILRPYKDKFKIVAGFRRVKAHLLLKQDDEKFAVIKSIVRTDIDEKQARFINLNENLNRKDLNIAEEALALKPLFLLGLTEVDICKQLPGKSRGWVQVRVLLLKLPREIQEEAAAGLITTTQIRDLYSLKYKGATDDVLFSEVRKAKDAKSKGEAHKIIKKEPKKQTASATKRIRPPHEIYVLTRHIVEKLGGGIPARTLAWATGEISDLDFFLDLKDYADKNNIEYNMLREIDYGVQA